MDWQDFHYDAETRAMIESVRDNFVRNDVIQKEIAECDDKALFPSKTFAAMQALGLFGILIPQEYGGSGLGTRIASLVARELASISGGAHLIWTANSSLATFPILYAGTEAQKKITLPLLAEGKILGCFALTESDAGSDAASLITRAEKRGDRWILNGTKTFITNAKRGSLMILFARTGKEKHAISAFIVDASAYGILENMPGITVNKIEKRAMQSSDFCEIVCTDAEIPEDALLGTLHKGFPIAMATLDGGRINIAAQALGIAGSLFDKALAYAKTRQQFGKSLWGNQVIQHYFAEWYAQLLSQWFAVDTVSRIRDESKGRRITELASSVKLTATETAYAVSSRMTRVFGGMSITREIDAFEKLLQANITTIYEGSSEMQKVVLTRFLSK